MSANTIPDDVMRAAATAWIDMGFVGDRLNQVPFIARAILAERVRATDAERMRCYAIAEAEYRSHLGPFCSQPASVAAWSIAEAINPPSAASSRAEQTGEAQSSQASPVANSDWITWNGGRCPVPAGRKTEVKFRSGQVETDSTPEYWSWLHLEVASDIIAYRIVPNLTHEEAQ